ncbi:type III secretion system needle filament subunit SctF [Escherichia coli]|uniref:type III secretion system needle filament subunit SctF n=1 Tax=Escherichia coli TaxID=562 RepID=UPI001D13902D|nr:type III secretion system needle filament subunit SctF [Escherichia coli]EIG1887028.1 type III secretion system needle filament subunit SctF [Escherichia coli]HEI2790263.1 type III secretion system needle filament subunit SctF [Escherichia coli]HEI3621601.1 type III secretion system needle filament subunit SctF [Escherichia coli]HEI3671913.1 type III secretion system needle filament subunit SctF [Escherichia coli]HEI4217059.1 type III secretion system needle filament subunit SctF [Escherich
MTSNNILRVNDNNYYLDQVSAGFEDGASSMIEQLRKAEAELQADPSDPAVLANYQSKLQQYTLFRNAQTSTVKVYKDIGSAIIQNFH